MHSGARQACPLSPLSYSFLWNLDCGQCVVTGFQGLNMKIKEERNFTESMKIFTRVDDITVLVGRIGDRDVFFGALHNYSAAA